MQPVRKAVIPAVGLGTRFLPATKALAKEMLPIVDKPTIQFIIEEALASGIEDIVIIDEKSKRSIKDHFDSNPELESNLKEKGKRYDIGSKIGFSTTNIEYGLNRPQTGESLKQYIKDLATTLEER